MDYNEILNKAKLEESKDMVKLYEAQYYDALTDTLAIMDESERNETLSTMNEKALFGSLQSQVKKMTNQTAKTQQALVQLQSAIQSDPKFKTDKGLQTLNQNVANLIAQSKDIQTTLQNPEFIKSYQTVDANTGLFGGNKGNGATSGAFIK